MFLNVTLSFYATTKRYNGESEVKDQNIKTAINAQFCKFYSYFHHFCIFILFPIFQYSSVPHGERYSPLRKHRKFCFIRETKQNDVNCKRRKKNYLCMYFRKGLFRRKKKSLRNERLKR